MLQYTVTLLEELHNKKNPKIILRMCLKEYFNFATFEQESMTGLTLPLTTDSEDGKK